MSPLGLTLACAVLAAAQQTPPVFESAVDLVAVDVTVLDGRGTPVRGLRSEDFSVTIDGKPRRVVSAEFVDLSTTTAGEPPPEAGHFSTNEGARPGRLVIVAVDQAQISAGDARSVVRAADRLLDQLTPADRAGLVAFPAPGPGVEPTADLRLVREALSKVVGRAPRRFARRLGPREALAHEENEPFVWDQAVSRECPESLESRERAACIQELESEAFEVTTSLRQQSAASIRALGALFETLGVIEGPKAVLLLTEGLFAEDAGQVRSLAARASAARVSLFVLQIETPLMPDAAAERPSPSALEDRDLRDHPLSALAALARGTVFRVNGSGEAAYERISRELSGHYVLAVEPEGPDRDGREHDVRVTTDRKPLVVRARGRLRIPPPGDVPKLEQMLAAALRAPFPETDLRLRLTTYTLRDPSGDRLRLLIAAEVRGFKGSTVAYAYQLLEESGRVAATGARQLTELPATTSLPILASVSVARASYRLKFAAVDASGRRGTVERTVNAVLASAGDIETGDLLLGAAGNGAEVLRPGVDVESGPGGLAAQVEVYAAKGAPLDALTVAFEVAETGSGPALLRVPARLAARPDGNGRVAQARIGADLLPPGNYVARATISKVPGPTMSVSRPFHVRSRGAEPGGADGIPADVLAASVPRFDRAELLRPEVVGHFVDRMNEIVPGPLSGPLQEAIARARRGESDRIGEALLSADSADPRVIFLRGIGYLARNALSQASAAFHQAVGLASNLLPATVYLGACSAATGEDREAAGAWQTALVSEASSRTVYGLLADALLRSDDAARAADVAKEALESWPDDAAMRRRLGLASARLGRAADALELLTPYVESHPDDVPALFVTLRLLLSSLATAGSERSTPAVRERAIAYARRYLQAQGPNRDMVAHWLRFLEKGGSR